MTINKSISNNKDTYTIGEISRILDLDQHVIRFWGNNFSQYIKPVRKAGQRRCYSKKDLEMLKIIKDLLHNKGLSIKGAQQLLQEKKQYNSLLSDGSNQIEKIKSISLQLKDIISKIEHALKN